MSNKFLLSSTSQNLANEKIFAQTLGAVTLDPSRPVRTNGQKELVSGLIEVSEINGLNATLESVLTNPYPGDLICHDLQTNFTFSLNQDLQATQHIRLGSEDEGNEKTELVGSLLLSKIENKEMEDIAITNATNDINLTSASGSITLNANSIELNSSNLSVNGSSIAFNLQDVYDNSVDGVTELDAGKPYVIKAVDTSDLLSADGDSKRVEITGDLLVNGNDIEDELINLEDSKYDKTGGVLTGDFIHNGNNVQFQGQGALQIQNLGPVQIQPTGALILKGHGVIGEINMSNHKIVNLATPTEPFDVTTKAYVDDQTVNNASLIELQNKTQNIGSVIENEITYFAGRIQLNDTNISGNSVYVSPDEHTLVIARGAGNNFELKHEQNRGSIKMPGGLELNTNFAYVTDGTGLISLDPVQNIFTITKNATANFTVTAEDSRTVLRSNQTIESEQSVKVVNTEDSSTYVQIFPNFLSIDNATNQLILTPTLIRSSVSNIILDAPKVQSLSDIIAPNMVGVPITFGGSSTNGVYLIVNGVADESLTASALPGIKNTGVCPIDGICRSVVFIKGLETVTSNFEINLAGTTRNFSINGRSGQVSFEHVHLDVGNEITIRQTGGDDPGDLIMVAYISPESN
jgi:hypothetical protein